jgi:AraC family transcriptional regulator
MTTIDTSTFATPDARSERAASPWWVADQDLLQEGPFKQSETSRNLTIALPAGDLFYETVEISPIHLVKRHRTGRYGILAESIYAPVRSSIKIHYVAPVHLLVLYEDGARREGETWIDGVPESRLRKFAGKLTFVPAGHCYREWHETSEAVRLTYLYLDPARLKGLAHADVVGIPNVFFEDSMLWATAVKLKNALESNNPDASYLKSLVDVLTHELSRSGRGPNPALPQHRGGLASWQKRAVTAYIDEHLNEQIRLPTLAHLAGLSQHHFCRAFKRSFGVPPHGYHVQRRIQQAKLLLSDPAASIMEVGLLLGYPHSSSFSIAFRKITGQTPSEFRRHHK